MTPGAYMGPTLRLPRMRLPRRRPSHACAHCAVAAGAHPNHLVLDTAQLELVVEGLNRLIDDRPDRRPVGLTHLFEFLAVRLAVARRNDRRAGVA